MARHRRLVRWSHAGARPPPDRTAESRLRRHRHAAHGGDAAHHQRRGPEGRAAVEREIPAIARAVDADRRRAAKQAAGCSTSAPAPADGSACWTPPNARPPSACRRRWCRASWPAAKPRSAAPPKPPRTIPPSASATCSAAASPRSDVLVGIAASGRTPYVLGAVAEARRLGAVTIGICCTPDSELSRAVDIAIAPLVGPGDRRRLHAHEGRHRTETGTQHALHRSVHPAGICLRQPDGERPAEEHKLVDRARRIIAQAAGVSYERAGEAAGRRPATVCALRS